MRTSILVVVCLITYYVKSTLGIASYGLSFQEDGYMNDDSVDVWARYQDKLPELTTFSICTWIKFTYERIYNQLWSYCNNVQSKDDINLVCSSLRFEPGVFNQAIADQGFTQNTSKLFRQFRWNLVCGSYLAQGDTRMVTTIYFNGEKMFTQLHDTPNGLNKWFAEGEWFLGQDQDELGGSFEKQQSLSGVLSNVNVWSRILTDKEVERMSKCFDSPLGDIVNWNEANWELNNVKRIELDTSDFCIDFPDKNYFMFPERRSLESGYEVCHKLGGSVSNPLDKTENDLLTQLGDQFYGVCEAAAQSGKTLWIGIERENVSEKWVDIKSKERISYQNFKEGNGGGASNCVYMLTRSASSTGKWGSAVCSDQSPRRVCTVCEFYTKKTKFNLRGLCQDSRHDRTFTLESDGLGKPIFKGLSTSMIIWNDSASYWHLDHLRYSAEGFLFDETRKEYPIGRFDWDLEDRLCEIFEGKTTLTLTACSEDQFTCTDGTCQPLIHRCDLKADCPDRSDEEDCSKVIFPDDYEMGLAPKHTIAGKRVDDPLPVHLSVDILSFDQIDTVNMMIAVMMRINVTWNDRRVDFLNLRDDIYQNLVPEDEASEMWIPEIGFFNAKTGKVAKDEHYALMIRRDKSAEPFNPSRAREDNVYQGYKNALMYLRRYYAEYHCTFNLRFFPFDEQICKMEFKARTVTRQYLELIPGNLRYRGPQTLVEFVVSNVTMGPGRLNVTRSEIRIVIKLARQYTYHLSQSFFQSFLLGFLAYLTFWIDIADFTDRFMGSLTALLVLASLMSTLTESLPKTSYFKVIDFWLLFFLLSTSLNIAVHILVDRFYQKELKEKKSKNVVQKWSSKVNSHLSSVEVPENLYDKLPKGDKNDDFIPIQASQGLNLERKSGLCSKICGQITGKWTAQGINDFQKTLFPFIFLLFALLFSIFSYLKVGDIEPENMDE